MPKDRQQLLVGSLRRLVRRGTKTHLRRVLDKARSEDIAEALEGFLGGEARTVFHMLLEEPECAAEVASNFDHQ